MTSLSLVMPTNRTGVATHARILKACSWANDGIQVVIRDNSGDPAKAAFLAQINLPNVDILDAGPCDGLTNFWGALDQAKGRFVKFIADDDDDLDYGITILGKAAGEVPDEFAGITGLYVLEQPQGSMIVDYENLHDMNAITRLSTYLSFQGPNLLFYGAASKPLWQRARAILEAHPFEMSFHDQLVVLLLILGTRFAKVQRPISIIDNINWNTAESAHNTDAKFYANAGLDPIMHQFHWLVCGFEGASINKAHKDKDADTMVHMWLETMKKRHDSVPLSDHGSTLPVDRVNAIRATLETCGFSSRLPLMLDTICDLLALFSTERAQAYRAFWKEFGERRRLAA